MTVMAGTLHETLVEGGTGTETAKRAAGEVADHEKRPVDIATDLAWMKAPLGVIVAGVAAPIVRSVFG